MTQAQTPFATMLWISIASLALQFQATAGTAVIQTEQSAPSLNNPLKTEPWQFTTSAYGWLAGLKGTTGLKGFTTEVDVPFGSILSHLDMTASINVEAQKGRWGGWIDAMYLKVSAGGSTPDPLLNTVSVSIEQVAAEAAIYYRMLDTPRGSIDIYAGSRYMSMGGELDLSFSSAGVDELSSAISNRVVDQIVVEAKSKARSGIQGKLSSKKAQLGHQISDKASEVLDNIQSIAQAHPGLVQAIKSSSQLRNAIRKVADARIDEEILIQEAKSATQTAKAAIKVAQAKAKRIISKAEAGLAKEINAALRNTIPTHLSASKSWVDPFIGMRAYYNLTENIYTTTKSDIGGFGVSSDLAWQVYAGLGYRFSGGKTLEVGYKYMAVDYTSGDFINDVATSGVFINFGMKF